MNGVENRCAKIFEAVKALNHSVYIHLSSFYIL